MSNKKEIYNKFWESLVVLIIIGIVLCCIANIVSTEPINISFIKDVFSILISILAVYMAIHLFSDWKEQYNINLNKDNLKNFRLKLDRLYIMTDYFEVHFRGINETLTQYPQVNDFHKVMLDYEAHKKELFQKRREFSHIINEYNFYLNYYTQENPKFDEANEFEKINTYGIALDRIIECFDNNNTHLFKILYNGFDQNHLILREMLGTQVNDLNERLKL